MTSPQQLQLRPPGQDRMSPARAIPVLRQLADGAIDSMGGVTPWSRDYGEACDVLGAVYKALDHFKARRW